MSHIEKLIEQLENALVPSRLLDYSIHYLVRGAPHRIDEIVSVGGTPFNEVLILKSGGASAGYQPPYFTGNIDDIDRLISRVFPDFETSVYRLLYEPCRAYLYPAQRLDNAEMYEGATPALALCVAFMREYKKLKDG